MIVRPEPNWRADQPRISASGRLWLSQDHVSSFPQKETCMRTLCINGSPNANGNTATLARVEHAMSRFAGYYGMEYLGLAENASEARKLTKSP